MTQTNYTRELAVKYERGSMSVTVLATDVFDVGTRSAILNSMPAISASTSSAYFASRAARPRHHRSLG